MVNFGAATDALLVSVAAVELAVRVTLPLDDPLSVTSPANPPLAPSVSWPTAVGFPASSTLNFDEPPTCRSMSLEAAAELVFVMFEKIFVNVVAPLFQVAELLKTGVLEVSVPCAMVRAPVIPSVAALL
jgi:hypothetical protein